MVASAGSSRCGSVTAITLFLVVSRADKSNWGKFYILLCPTSDTRISFTTPDSPKVELALRILLPVSN